MKLKRLVTSFMVVSLVFSFSTVHALSDVEISQSAPNVEISQPEQKKTIVQDLYAADGERLGEVRKELAIQVQKVSDGIELKVIENNDYDLEPKFTLIPEYKETFSDSTKTKTYLITNDNKVYTNGEFLMKLDDFSSLSSRRIKRDSGGVPSLCHYYDDGRYQNYMFKSYSSIDWSWTSGAAASGGYVEKMIQRENSYFSDAKSAVDSFKNNLNTTAVAFKTLVATLTAAGKTVRNIPALIAAGGVLGFEIACVLNYFDNAKDDIQRAYNYIRAA